MLSVIIPVKEPEPHLEQLIREIDSTLTRDWVFEILVQYEEGLTNAVVQGVKKARGNIILVMDADGAHKPEYIPQMLEKFGDSNIIIGVKDRDERGLWRKFVTKGFTLITRVVLGLKIHDLSGFVLAEKYLFAVVKPSDDFKFILPLLYLNPKATVYEFPVTHPDRIGGKSKANYKQAFKIIKLIFKLRMGLY